MKKIYAFWHLTDPWDLIWFIDSCNLLLIHIKPCYPAIIFCKIRKRVKLNWTNCVPIPSFPLYHCLRIKWTYKFVQIQYMRPCSCRYVKVPCGMSLGSSCVMNNLYKFAYIQSYTIFYIIFLSLYISRYCFDFYCNIL